jgi:DNA replication protein DnaC
VTLDEANKFGIEIVNNVPNVINCLFCNKELHPIGRRHLLRKTIVSWGKYQECDCVKAVEAKETLQKFAEEKIREESEIERRLEFQTRVKKLFNQSKLGSRFQNRTFEMFQVNDKNHHAFDTAKNYVTEFEKLKKDGVGLIFNGTKGTGKTHLAASITIELINQGIPVIMGTLITLLGMIKQAYSENQSEQELIDLYSRVDLLVIDDLGKEKVTEWVLEKLYLIINNRYENNLPVIITTNYDIDGLVIKLSTLQNQDTAEAITSRLWEMCIGVEMNWEDYRKQ